MVGWDLPPCVCPDSTCGRGRCQERPIMQEMWDGYKVETSSSRNCFLLMPLPVDALLNSPTVVGFVDAVSIVFVSTEVGVFSIDLKSERAMKVHDGNGCNVLPYMSFYTPAVQAASAGEGPSAGASSA